MSKKNVPMFEVGDLVKHPQHGVGMVRKTEAERMFPNYEFFYYICFTGRKSDGTKVWLSKAKAEKDCHKIKRKH